MSCGRRTVRDQEGFSEVGSGGNEGRNCQRGRSDTENIELLDASKTVNGARLVHDPSAEERAMVATTETL